MHQLSTLHSFIYSFSIIRFLSTEYVNQLKLSIDFSGYTNI